MRVNHNNLFWKAVFGVYELGKNRGSDSDAMRTSCAADPTNQEPSEHTNRTRNQQRLNHSS